MGFSKGAWLHRGWKREKIMKVSKIIGAESSSQNTEWRIGRWVWSRDHRLIRGTVGSSRHRKADVLVWR